MIFLRKYYRWRYFRRRQSQSRYLDRSSESQIDLSFGRPLDSATREGKKISGFRDREKRRRKRLLLALGGVLLLAFLAWVVSESIYGLSLF